MTRRRRLQTTLSIVYIAALAAGIWATRGIDSQTGQPTHRPAPHSTPTIVFEDGSARYSDGSKDSSDQWAPTAGQCYAYVGDGPDRPDYCPD